MLEPAADLDQRADGVAQAQEVAPQQVEPFDLRPRHPAREHKLFLHLLDFFLDVSSTGE